MGWPGWEWWKVNWVDVGISTEHQLEFEPLDFLYAGFWISSWRQSISDIWTPANDLLVLIVVKDCRNLDTSQQQKT